MGGIARLSIDRVPPFGKAVGDARYFELPPPPPTLRSLREAGAVALFLDFDGTLVHLADTPEGIEVPDDLADGLVSLADRMDNALALVSGRSIRDLERHLGVLSVARAGSHGIDRRHPDGTSLGIAPEPMPPEAEAQVRRFTEERGFSLETKPHGCALHFRRNPQNEQEGFDFASELAEEHGLAVKRGKFVIELVRPGADKGGAVRAFMEAEPFAGRLPVFVGDDVTDEDGMVAATELGGFGILVGDRLPSAARYRLEDPAAVYDWLDL